MPIQSGTIIKSTAALNDTYFQGTTIIITEHDKEGAVGFIINKPFHKKLNYLEEFKHLPSLPLYEGGPMDQEHLFFIHNQPPVINDGIEISPGLYFGGNFNQALKAINSNQISTKDIKIFIGYCGWDASELEAEIKEGSWEEIKGESPF